jgi:hypothetical protein
MRIAHRVTYAARTDGFVILLAALALAFVLFMAVGPRQWFGGSVVSCLGSSTIRPDGGIECTGGIGRSLPSMPNIEAPAPQPYGPR